MIYDLERFVQAQERVIGNVRRELRDGRKQTHWMWFVFPQLRGLGLSAMARHFAICSLEEAEDYLNHRVLGPRLIECTELVKEAPGRSVATIFGAPDDQKFHSSMTLFSRIHTAPPVFDEALVKFFDGVLDELTMQILVAAASSRRS